MEEGRDERGDPARRDRYRGVQGSLRQARGERLTGAQGGGGIAASADVEPGAARWERSRRARDAGHQFEFAAAVMLRSTALLTSSVFYRIPSLLVRSDGSCTFLVF